VIDRWTLYRDFAFDSNRVDIRPSETNKVSEIALYMKANPSLKVGIDAFTQPSNALSDKRTSIVRDALINAGVAASRIEAGTFDDRKLTRDGRVAVMIRTAN
jgi:outer membrane protein OmpA-like peptidoglycan-associated protein